MLGETNRLLDVFRHLVLDGFILLVSQDPLFFYIGSKAFDRITLIGPLGDLFPGTIQLWVAKIMPVKPVGLALQQGRTFAAPRSCNRFASRFVHGQDIHTIHLHAGDPVSRRQVRWVVFAFGVFFTAIVALGNLPEILLEQPLISWNAQALLFLPVLFAMAIGILKYRLFDIETKVNRTLVYAGLTTLVVGIYVLIVGVAGVFFQTSDNLLISVLVIGVVAVLFQPLREQQGLCIFGLCFPGPRSCFNVGPGSFPRCTSSPIPST